SNTIRTACSRTSGEYLFPNLFFSITQYPYFRVSGKQGAVQIHVSLRIMRLLASRISYQFWK
ncbi:MAG: hypothetical protein P8Q92_04480, partial [Pseudoprimorskyibacter sp.]|nr:hypothetical protein [Pseudoprimorskyibacter sp.]